MKIGIVCPYNMFYSVGGVEQLVRHLHDGLLKKGHDVKIITPRPSAYKSDPPKDFIFLGKSRTLGTGLGMGTAGDWGMETDGSEIKEMLEREKFDVINFHEAWAPMLGWQILNYSTAAHVGSFHANLVDSKVAKSFVGIFTPYGRSVISKLHLLTVVSPAPAELLKQKVSDGKDQGLINEMRLIPNGIDLSVYKPFKKRRDLSGPNTQTIVYVGRLDRRKGVEWLVKAYTLLVREMPNCHLVIAGSGERMAKLKQLVKEHNLKNVHFTGYVSDEEKRTLLGNADLVCAPALFGESFGIILLEAMAMGTPVLAGNNIGYKNVVKDFGRIGMVDPTSIADFASRMQLFLTDKKLWSQYRDWELKEVKQYSYPKVIDAYENAYIAAINKWRIQKHMDVINGSNDAKFWKKVKSSVSLRRRSK